MELALDQSITVKGEKGRIKYYGETQFSSGKWVGVELDVPKGKNDGSVGGKRYFTCEKSSENGFFGIFVRPSVVKPTDTEATGKPVDQLASMPAKSLSIMPPPSLVNTPKTRSVSRASDSSGHLSTILSPVKRGHGKSDSISVRSVSSSIQNGSATPVPLNDNDMFLNQKIDQLKSKLKIMEKKRKEDSERIQNLQSEVKKVQRYENVAQRLQLKLKSTLDELHALRGRVQALEQENARLNDENDEEALEMATLDKEMAEERCEALLAELKTARTKIEELQLDFDILKEENELITSQSSSGAVDTAAVLTLEKRNEKLENALMRLREVSLNEENVQKNKISNLEKELNDYKAASKELVNITSKLNDAETVIADLHARLDNSLGAEDMIESLTEKNLELNERIDTLQNTIDELETLKELHDELEDNQKMREDQLNKEIRSLESLNNENQRQMQEITTKNEYLETSITKYRELVEALDKELDNYKSQKPAEIPAVKRSDGLREATIGSKSDLVEFELRKFESQQAIDRLEIVQCYLSEGYSEDEPAIESLFLIEKLAFLCNLYRSHFLDIIEQNEPLISRICFVLCDLEIDSRKIGDYLRHCSSSEFGNLQEIHRQIVPVTSVLVDSVDSLRSGNIRETEFLTELETTKSVIRDIVSTKKANQSSYCQQSFFSMKLFTSLILRLERSRSFWKNSSFSLIQCKSMINRHLEDFAKAINAVKKPNSFTTSGISLIKDSRIFLRSFAKLIIGLQNSDSSDKTISAAKKYLSETINDEEALDKYFDESIRKLRKVQDLKLTEFMEVPTSPWLSRSTVLNKVKNQQRELNEEISSLKDQMKKLTVESFNKDKHVEELQVNLDVLNARLSKSKGQLTDINKIKEELNNSLQKEKNLQAQMQEVKKMAAEQEKALEQFRNSDIFGFGAKSLESTMPLLALQGENASLKAALSYAVRIAAPNSYSLLGPAVPSNQVADTIPSLAVSAHGLFKNLRATADNFEIVQLESVKGWKPKARSIKLQYLEQVRAMAELDCQLEDVLSK